MNDKNIPEQIAAKEKAIAIIESCTLCEHFTNAEIFLNLYRKLFNDQEEYNELINLMKSKKIELKCYD